jgi:hypothetical protein
MENQPPLYGISLVPLLEGRMKTRPKPMGFWDHPTRGIGTPSKKLMAELYELQQSGKEVDDPARLRSDAGKITKKYPEDTYPGHAAWLDWPWKLHRIENKKNVKIELYNLQSDPQEKNDLSAQNPERTETMRSRLEQWQKSVVKSLNGEDY